MVRWWALKVCLCLFALLFASLATDRATGQEPQAPTPPPGPSAAFLTHRVTRINAGDSEGALALLTDDVSLVGGPPCNINPCVGKDAVRARVLVAINNRTHYTLTQVSAAGNLAKTRAEKKNNAASACGIQRFIADVEVEMRGQLIARHSFLNDLSDRETAAFTACVAAGGGAPPQPAPVVRPPATGDAGLVSE